MGKCFKTVRSTVNTLQNGKIRLLLIVPCFWLPSLNDRVCGANPTNEIEAVPKTRIIWNFGIVT